MTRLPEAIEQAQSTRQDSLRVKLIPFFDRYGIIVVIIAIGLVLTILEPEYFLTWRNLTNVTRQ